MSTPTPERPRDLAGLLLKSLEQLAATGEVDAACRIAGEACALLRPTDARGTQRFNALLHRLTRPPRPAAAAPPSPSHEA